MKRIEEKLKRLAEQAGHDAEAAVQLLLHMCRTPRDVAAFAEDEDHP